MQDQTGKINNPAGKYIMELSKLKDLQRQMTPFELNYRKFERQAQIQQISLTFTAKIEGILEILETADIDTTQAHSMIEPFVNRNIVNKLQHKNVPNPRQYTHKNTSQQHQHRNSSQQYQHIYTSQQYQHKNNSQ